ncbi:hypothetical protein C8R44DRAFT_212183 [Mycena epipterygia]|nr:hypothetical protein C8R44DRAFT_212183 [Mycena epipterygia]
MEHTETTMGGFCSALVHAGAQCLDDNGAVRHAHGLRQRSAVQRVGVHLYGSWKRGSHLGQVITVIVCQRSSNTTRASHPTQSFGNTRGISPCPVLPRYSLHRRITLHVTLSGHVQFCAIPILVSLIPLVVPLELEDALFNTLAAFCQPGAGVQICKTIWTLM